VAAFRNMRTVDMLPVTSKHTLGIEITQRIKISSFCPTLTILHKMLTMHHNKH